MPKLCQRCGKREIERIDDWESTQCGWCNDRDIERSNARREWDYYHNEREPDGKEGQWAVS